VEAPYYSESELCGGAVTVSLSKYLPWQAMHFLQRSSSLTLYKRFVIAFLMAALYFSVVSFHVNYQ
jgi:hypothetical protein